LAAAAAVTEHLRALGVEYADQRIARTTGGTDGQEHSGSVTFVVSSGGSSDHPERLQHDARYGEGHGRGRPRVDWCRERRRKNRIVRLNSRRMVVHAAAHRAAASCQCARIWLRNSLVRSLFGLLKNSFGL